MTDNPIFNGMIEDNMPPAKTPHGERPTERVSQDEAEFTHYVHLADGRVVLHTMTEPLGIHYPGRDNEEHHGGNKIIGVYPR